VYEIRDRKLLNKREGVLLKSSDELYISKIEGIDVRTGLLDQISNAHDIVFRTESGKEYVWKNVPNASAVKMFIQSIIEDGASPRPRGDQDDKSSAAPGTMPAGVVLSSNVIVLPRLSDTFDRALWVQHGIVDQHPIRGPYGSLRWVNRGDPLYSFGIKSSTFSKRKRISITSPVSGLELWNGRPFVDPGVTILLPENEPAPLPTSAVFGALCSYCADHLEYIFLKSSYVHESREHVESEMRKQLASEYTFKDITADAGIVYRESYIEWIGKLLAEYPRPDLAGLAEQLRKQPAHGAPKTAVLPDLPIKERSKSLEVAQDPSDFSDSSRNSETEEARLRWNLPENFTEKQVETVYNIRIDRVLESKVPQLNRDYRLLLAAAASR
jgi:Bacterial PH domain